MAELSGNILTDNGMLSGAISAQQNNMGGDIIPGMVIGIPGKSAYEYALSAGYTGTEIEFAEALAQIGQGSGNVDEETVRRIVDDYLAENPPSSGSAGATFYPSVDSDGNLYWSNDQGLPNPDPVNIMGPKGETGSQGGTGPQGPAGPTGKTAFEYAQDGGYTGSEQEFAESLATLVNFDLLWENANPDSEFPAQTISMDTAPYQLFYIECTHKDGSVMRTSAIIRKSQTAMMFGFNVSYFYRPVTPISTGIKFSQGYKYSGGAETKYDLACVPLRVYGISGVN